VPSLLTDEIRALIGLEASFTAPEELGRAAIRYFAIAIGDENPLYVDDEYARAEGYPSVIAPPTLVCETNQYMSGRPNGDGYIGHQWALPLSGLHAIRGGNEYEFHRPLLPHHRITARWRIADIQEKLSSRGIPMLVVVSDVAYSEQSGELLATNRETTIYQPREG
jgi:acyl dehydratase